MNSYLTSVTFRSPYGSYCSENNNVLATLGVLLAERCVSKTKYSNMTKNESNLVFVASNIITNIINKIKFFYEKLPIHPQPKGRGFLGHYVKKNIKKQS